MTAKSKSSDTASPAARATDCSTYAVASMLIRDFFGMLVLYDYVSARCIYSFTMDELTSE